MVKEKQNDMDVKKKRKAALIGCGALGSIVARNFQRTVGGDYTLLGVMNRDFSKAEALSKEVECRAYETIEALLWDAPDLVIETAGTDAVLQYGRSILESGADLCIVSIGALEDAAFREELEKLAEEKGCRIYLPCGAIGGFDVLRTLQLMGDLQVSIENVKAPASLNGAPYLQGKPLPETEEQKVFEGNVREAIQGFPKNVNVAVAAALASGQEDTRVTIQSVPALTENCHRIRAVSALSAVEMVFKSSPDPENPKSSTITAWSILALLRNLASTIQYF